MHNVFYNYYSYLLQRSFSYKCQCPVQEKVKTMNRNKIQQSAVNGEVGKWKIKALQSIFTEKFFFVPPLFSAECVIESTWERWMKPVVQIWSKDANIYLLIIYLYIYSEQWTVNIWKWFENMLLRNCNTLDIHHCHTPSPHPTPSYFQFSIIVITRPCM